MVAALQVGGRRLPICRWYLSHQSLRGSITSAGPEDAQLTHRGVTLTSSARTVQTPPFRGRICAPTSDDLRMLGAPVCRTTHGPNRRAGVQRHRTKGDFWPCWTSCSRPVPACAGSREDLIGYARAGVLDIDRFIADLDSPAVIEALSSVTSSGAFASGGARPSYVLIEGRRLLAVTTPRTLTAVLEASRRGPRNSRQSPVLSGRTTGSRTCQAILSVESSCTAAASGLVQRGVARREEQPQRRWTSLSAKCAVVFSGVSLRSLAWPRHHLCRGRRRRYF